MKFLLPIICLFAAAPAVVFVAARDNGPITFALLENCQQRFKCTVGAKKAQKRSTFHTIRSAHVICMLRALIVPQLTVFSMIRESDAVRRTPTSPSAHLQRSSRAV